MAVDQTIEYFTYELFNNLWQIYGIINEPLTRKGNNETPVESEFNENILNAIGVRLVLFDDSYTRIFIKKYMTFKNSTADFYAFLVQYFPHKEYCYKSVMDKIIAVCAFVAFSCSQSYFHGNNLFIADSYLFCAMYIDEELKNQFYKEGGWLGLNRICQSYVSVYDFLMEYSLPVENGPMNITFHRRIHEFINRIYKFQLFINNIPLLETFKTANWMYHCLEDMKDPSFRSKKINTRKHYSVEDTEAALTDLKNYCDPVALNMRKFDKACELAIADKLNPKLFLNAYFQSQIEKCAPENEVMSLVLRSFTHLVLTNPSSQSQSDHQSQSCNTQVDEAETQPPPSLSSIENRFNDINTRMELLDEKLNKFSELTYPILNHPPSTLKTFKDAKDIMSGKLSNLDTTSFSCTQISSNYARSSGGVKMKTSGGKRNSPNIQVSEARFSPTRTFSRSPSTLKVYENKKDQIIDEYPNLDVSSLSQDGIEISPNHAQGSRTKNIKFGGRENTRIIRSSETKFLPAEVIGESPNMPKVFKNKGRVIGKLSNVDVDSHSLDEAEISQNHARSSGATNKKSCGKENFQIVQCLETKYSPASVFSGFLSNPKASENDNDQVIGLLSNQDINALSSDGTEIYQDHVRSSISMKKRAKGKENSPKIQRAQPKLSPGNILPSSLSTPPNSSVLKLDKCEVPGEIIVNDDTTCLSHHSQDLPPNTSITSKAEKGKVTPEVVENKSKPHSEALSHDLPPSTSLKKCINQLTGVKVYRISPTNLEDFGGDQFPSKSNTTSVKRKVNHKVANSEDHHARTHTEHSSQAQLKTGVPSASKPYAGKKNKKKSKKTRKT